MISTAHLHTCLDDEITKEKFKIPLEEVGKIRHLVRIRFDSSILKTYKDIKNLTEQDNAELCAIYQENLDKGYIPED